MKVLTKIEDQPLISILLPAYNVAPYITEAVNSILCQTYCNFELIIVDDCSTDRTFEILEILAKTDNRIRLFRNETNLKIADTLNFALSKAEGSFIGRMDGDDLCVSDRFEKQLFYLISNPEISLVGNGINLINQDGEFIQHELFPTDYSTIKKCILYSSPVLHIWLAKREVYDLLNGYRMSGVEDYDFLLRMITNGMKFTNINECLYSVRLREGNTISTMGLFQRKSFNYAKKLFRERQIHGVDSFSLEKYRRFTKTSVVENFLYSLSASNFKKYIMNKKSPIGFLFILLSIICSPYYQFEYLKNRFIYKLIVKRS